MERYLFPKAPFEKAQIHSFVTALEAELQEAEAAGGNVESLRTAQQESIDSYAATLSDGDATEFLLMCAAERLFLQTDPFANEPRRTERTSANQASWVSMMLGLKALNPGRALTKVDVGTVLPAAIGFSLGAVVFGLVAWRVYVLFSS
jgi:hypothetical protein